MRRIAIVPFHHSLNSDRLFSTKGNPYWHLQQYMKEKGIEVHTIDFFSEEQLPDAVICFDVYPFYRDAKIINKFLTKDEIIKILVITECPIIYPKNYSNKIHDKFNYIFTWNDRLVDNNRYIKYFWPQHKDACLPTQLPYDQKQLLVLINANKFNTGKDELYSERRKAIEYFEKNIPDQFDLYGYGWNDISVLQAALGIQELLKSFSLKNLGNYLKMFIRPKSCKGEAENKFSILANYKFAICYENMENIDGYITEKIWDCFKMGVVPVYLGASNICSFVPNDCYIDKRDYSYSELLEVLQSINEKTFFNYQSNIKAFLKSRRAAYWFDKNWAVYFGKRVRSLVYEN